jgi:hypothetical protein
MLCVGASCPDADGWTSEWKGASSLRRGTGSEDDLFRRSRLFDIRLIRLPGPTPSFLQSSGVSSCPGAGMSERKGASHLCASGWSGPPSLSPSLPPSPSLRTTPSPLSACRPILSTVFFLLPVLSTVLFFLSVLSTVFFILLNATPRCARRSLAPGSRLWASSLS